MKTYPSETYFFLADVAPHDASVVAAKLREQGILIKALNDGMLGPGFMRVTTALPADNRRFLDAMRAVLAEAY
ncbi:MAG: hypothetical protein MRJ92_14020 [Nitrospira sp.]|nr:hypothetical protein [Nitrospira sp.]